MTVNMRLGDTQLILAECQRHGLLRNQTAYVLATAFWETARTMEPVREAFWLSEEWRRENLRYHPWYGRGFVQLTWENNYVKAGTELGLDLTRDPDVVMQPEISAQILVMGSREGWFTGRGLDQYITLQKSDYVGARRIINGTDKAQAIAEIAREYEQQLLADGYGVEQPLAPVVNERRDGTSPRSNPASSTTIQAVIAAAVATVGQTLESVKSVVSQVSESLGVSPEMALAVVAGGALLWIFRERWTKWLEGDR